jgi:hypothetical protein
MPMNASDTALVIAHTSSGGVAARRGRAVRYQHNNRQPWVLPPELLTEQSTNFAEPSIADYDERREATRVLERPERTANWRSGQARAGVNHHRGPRAPAAPLHRRRRCDCYSRTENRRSEGADRGEPETLDIACIRLSARRDAYEPTSPRIVRSACDFCVRTVSHDPRNRRGRPSFTGHVDAHRCCGSR